MTPSFYYILPVYTHQLLQIQNSLQIPIHEIIILIVLLTLVVAIIMLCYTHPFKKYIANNPTTVLQPKGITYHLHILMNYQLQFSVSTHIRGTLFPPSNPKRFCLLINYVMTLTLLFFTNLALKFIKIIV